MQWLQNIDRSRRLVFYAVILGEMKDAFDDAKDVLDAAADLGLTRFLARSTSFTTPLYR